MNVLNVLNGDATFCAFREANIKGDVLIWREILSEGPVSNNNLWKKRAEWIYKTFGETPTSFKKNVIKEAEKLNNITPYNEINLWFEYDLVCQINLIYILHQLLPSYSKAKPIYLICPDKIVGIPNFRGLGELAPNQFNQLYKTRIKLKQSDLKFASKAWDLYVQHDPINISSLLNEKFGNLQLLKPALKAHLLRFKNSNELNIIEETLINIVNAGITNKLKIYETFSASQSIYGMGDLQIDIVLKDLKKQGLIKLNL